MEIELLSVERERKPKELVFVQARARQKAKKLAKIELEKIELEQRGGAREEARCTARA